jgi:hypothetical protein
MKPVEHKMNDLPQKMRDMHAAAACYGGGRIQSLTQVNAQATAITITMRALRGASGSVGRS